MIAEGWFGGKGQPTPSDPGSAEFAIWQANFHPECAAHDLLADMSGGGHFPGGGWVRELGLTLSERPCTPRYATATLDHTRFLPPRAARVDGRTECVTVRPASQR